MGHYTQVVDVAWRDSSQAGSCSACAQYFDVRSHRFISHRVAQVKLRGVMFQLCDRCRAELQAQLAADRVQRETGT